MTSSSVQLTALLTSVAACVGLAAAFFAAIKRYRGINWSYGGKLKKIFVYPIKSLPPFEVPYATLTPEGLQYEGVRDREFLILDADQNNKFITARSEPSLLLLETSYDVKRNCLIIRSNNPQKQMEPLEIAVDLQRLVNTAISLRVKTWEQNGIYEAHKCEAKVSVWFSKYIGKNIILARLIPGTEARSKHLPKRFQDTADLNVLSERSVENLLELIQERSANITFRNFRPNLLVETKHPFEEDFWYRAKIGKAETEFHSRCDRCLFTTIVPDTGLKTDKEPLTTLRKFRVDRSAEGISKYKLKPLFSCHHTIRSCGTICVGQTIFVETAARALL